MRDDSRLARVVLATVLVAMPIAVAEANPLDVRLNEVQVLGTHNSYHIQPEQRILDVLSVIEPALAIGFEYTHKPLTEQFTDLGIRQIELDVFADPAGGLYASRAAFVFFGEDPASGIPELDDPGFKVLHVQDIDFDTTCLTLVLCLEELKAWSDANPWHLPIMVLIEAKDDPIPDDFMLGFAIPIPIGPTELDDLDAEIRSVFPDEQLITPDDIRGAQPTLEDAVLTDGWPTLLDARGKVLFALDNGGSIRSDYITGHPSLTGRVMFTNSAPGTPEAAFIKMNGPVGNEAQIAQWVADGYIIRTRADADTLDARTGSTVRRDAALISGAQFVSSDYPELDPFGMGYIAEIPDGNPGRCNPINSQPDCLSSQLELLDGFAEVAGGKLVVKDPDDQKRKLTFSARDPLVSAPLPGSGNEPTLTGATLMLSNPVTGETVKFELPGGANWKGLGNPAGSKGYKYTDPKGDNGPCKLLSIVDKSGTLKAKCLAKNGPIPFSLDEPTQGVLNVTVRLGQADTYCTSFGGTVKLDRSTSGGKTGAFIAKDAPPGGCPIP